MICPDVNAELEVGQEIECSLQCRSLGLESGQDLVLKEAGRADHLADISGSVGILRAVCQLSMD